MTQLLASLFHDHFQGDKKCDFWVPLLLNRFVQLEGELAP